MSKDSVFPNSSRRNTIVFWAQEKTPLAFREWMETKHQNQRLREYFYERFYYDDPMTFKNQDEVLKKYFEKREKIIIK